jgi:putative addiction module component (TIGR02574 family)
MQPNRGSPGRNLPTDAMVAGTTEPCHDPSMSPNALTELLKLPPGERAELAMALWESLSVGERDQAFELTDEQRAELDRRWAEHLQDPSTAIA